MPSIAYWLAYCGIGAVTGLIAGLFGVGGGIVIVPALYWLFSLQGFPQAELMHLALGTSLAIMVCTLLASYRVHARRGAVRWDIFKVFTPGSLLGAVVGAWIAARLSTQALKGAFVVLLYYVAVRMLFDHKRQTTHQLPRPAGLAATGCGIGLLANLLGISGGLMTVPFLLWCNVPIREAVGTAAASALPIAVVGTLGYLATGLSVRDLPPYCVGFISLPALAAVATTSMLLARSGAHLAHNLPVVILKRLFAVLLLAMGTRMLWTMF